MASRAVVDTHALIWYLIGSPKLGANARAVLDDPQSALYLSLIALAEACWIVEKGKASGIPSVTALLAAVDADARFVILPLDSAIFDLSFGLTSIVEMHDRLIVATAVYLSQPDDPVALLTVDGNITGSGLAPTIW